MRYAVSASTEYTESKVVIRDFWSEPKGRVLCIVPRDNVEEAQQTAQYLCDLLNKAEQNNEMGTV